MRGEVASTHLDPEVRLHQGFLPVPTDTRHEERVELREKSRRVQEEVVARTKGCKHHQESGEGKISLMALLAFERFFVNNE